MSAGTSDPGRRIRAPREHGGTLIEPPLAVAGMLIAENRRRHETARCELLSQPLVDLSSQARNELLAAARDSTAQYRDVPPIPPDGPILLAGHQPELFHAGVWFKNFVLAGLASAHGGVAINLVIDSDTLRSPAIRVPGGTIEQPTAQAIPFDAPGPQIPFEERAILDRATFDSFADRAAREIAPLVASPLVRQYWPLAIGRSGATGNLGACLAQARHQLEGQWGASSLELPQSRVCTLPSFHWFAAHLLTELPRLREVYNRSLAEYRRLHGVRSKNHPAPDLDAEGDWLEAPFWMWSEADPRRRRVFIRRQAEGLLLTDRAGIQIELPCGDRAVEALAELPQRRIKLRTRALITTLWARLALSDLFIHGIGGAKYDQLTDRILERFFGVDAPAYLTATATLRLPIHLPAPASDIANVEQANRQLREIVYHPERWLDLHSREVPPEDRQQVEQLRQSKARWIATPQTRDNARQRCRTIRAANESLSRWTRGGHAELLSRRDALLAQERAAAILSSREFAFCLFPPETLRNFLLEFLAVRSYPKTT
jgi:hypothetical protein